MQHTLDVLKALSQTTRLRMVLLLADAELCSCELGEILEISQPAVSQHMNVLKRAELVDERKSGTWVYYQLKRQNLEQALGWLSQAVVAPRSIAESKYSDWRRLDRLLAERQQNC